MRSVNTIRWIKVVVSLSKKRQGRSLEAKGLEMRSCMKNRQDGRGRTRRLFPGGCIMVTHEQRGSYSFPILGVKKNQTRKNSVFLEKKSSILSQKILCYSQDFAILQVMSIVWNSILETNAV
jgi:hypothetical protein